MWWFFDDFVPAWKARAVAGCVLDDCGLPGMVEIFPKQDCLMPGRFGNYINLPMFGQDVERGRTVFLDPEADYTPYKDQWSFLSAVTKISEAQLDEIVELNNLSKETASQTSMAQGAEVSGHEGVGLPCFSRMMQEGVDEGARNEASMRVSVNLYRTGIPKDLGLLIMREWNTRNRPPLETAELEKTVSNGYSGRYGYGCFSPLINQYCDPSCPIFRKHNNNRGSEVSSDFPQRSR